MIAPDTLWVDGKYPGFNARVFARHFFSIARVCAAFFKLIGRGAEVARTQLNFAQAAG